MFCFDYTAEKSKEKLCFDDLAQSKRIRNVLLWRTKICRPLKKTPKNVCELQYQMQSIFSATLNPISIFCFRPNYNLMFFNLSDLNEKRFLCFLNQQTNLLRNALLQVNLTRKRMFFEKKRIFEIPNSPSSRKFFSFFSTLWNQIPFRRSKRSSTQC
jgi:hypothetical protein